MACFGNAENQDFVFKFVKKLSDHFGFGEFVSESFQICFRDNFRILQQIHRERFAVYDESG